mmetsp:Transcript_112994/g.224993  ORF Transcript_112994/g.224993 Transcript_112994/m.224993 type:complete len:227 (+) Transcript_112994:675-1355(+)
MACKEGGMHIVQHVLKIAYLPISCSRAVRAVCEAEIDCCSRPKETLFAHIIRSTVMRFLCSHSCDVKILEFSHGLLRCRAVHHKRDNVRRTRITGHILNASETLLLCCKSRVRHTLFKCHWLCFILIKRQRHFLHKFQDQLAAWYVDNDRCVLLVHEGSPSSNKILHTILFEGVFVALKVGSRKYSIEVHECVKLGHISQLLGKLCLDLLSGVAPSCQMFRHINEM